MSYRLQANETSGSGLRRVAVEQLDQAIAHLTPRAGAPLGVEAVHEARKSMKRTRSALRLGRVAIPSEFSAWNQAIAAAARELSAWRDADALLEGFDRLVEWAYEQEATSLERPTTGTPLPLFPRLRAALLELQRAGGARPSSRTRRPERVIKALRTVRGQLEALDVAAIDAAALALGLKKIRRACRKAMREALAQREAELFHEWRKRAKHFWYASTLLSGVWPKAEGGLEAQARQLSRLLGADHDLVILREWVMQRAAQVFDGPEEQIAFVMLLDSMQEDLRRRAAKRGRRLDKAQHRGLAKALTRCDDKARSELPLPMAREAREADAPRA